MNGILIFSPHANNRLLFVLDFIFNGFTNMHWQLTNDRLVFEKFSGCKINYNNQFIGMDEIRIVPSGLLAEAGHQFIFPEIQWQNELPVLFPDKSAAEHPASLPFDIFSAIFYMLSRYEEYGHPAKDRFDRFPAKESLAFTNNFLHLPVVDLWLKDFLAFISAQYPSVVFPKKKTTVNFTYDIDRAFAYRGRGLMRQLGTMGKDFLKGNFAHLSERFKVLAGFAKDPFDNYDYIIQTSINPVFFFLLHQKLSPHDRNISPKKPLLRKLVQRIRLVSPIGIHPSYHSSVETGLLETERKTLEAISGIPITKSRQHYLRFVWPGTFCQLAQNGILEEHSMGFAETPGFRAGTCTPFYFFDLEKNEVSNMKIFPPCIMESTFSNYLAMPVQEVLSYFIRYFEAVNDVQGHFSCIWHNDSLRPNTNENDPENFRWLHEQILRYIRNISPENTN